MTQTSKLSRQDFEELYAQNTTLSVRSLFKPGAYVALPCHCGAAKCLGWAVVQDNETLISNHMRLYGKVKNK